MQQPQSLTPIADTMQQGVQDPTGDFITTLIRMVEAKGLNLDDIMKQDPTVEDGLNNIQTPAIAEAFSQEELVTLVNKFLKLPPDVQQRLEKELQAQLDPGLMQHIRSVIRFVQSRKQQ